MGRGRLLCGRDNILYHGEADVATQSGLPRASNGLNHLAGLIDFTHHMVGHFDKIEIPFGIKTGCFS